ncbi:hypothetical protein [Falsiroseomonas sp. HW251]|uniref:hypothetical protein n=1 Tax=Falsiroseomonas sp. HW251 TaxID=3390998 RepID=UPI003D31FD5B
MPVRFALLLLPALALPAAAQDRVPPRSAPPPLADSVDDAPTLMRLAASALAAGRAAQAQELLERAEARLLTRSELATEAGRPAAGGLQAELAAARDAIGRRDLASAQRLVADALRRWDRGEPAASATGTGIPPGASAGGGAVTPEGAVGGTASPPVPVGPGGEILKGPPQPGFAPVPSVKPPALP